MVDGPSGDEPERILVAGRLRGRDVLGCQEEGPPAGIESLSRDPLLERVYSFLILAVGQMFNGVDPQESLALARLGCDVGRDAPHGPVYESIVSLLDARADYRGDGDGRPSRMAPGVHLIVVAAALARTPDVPLPSNPRFAASAPGSASASPAC